MKRIFFSVHRSAFSVVLLLAGCVHPRESAHRPTDIDPKEATPDFWYAKPGVASANASDFKHLWDAADHVVRQHRFEIDERDPRQGVMTTLPLLCQQIWELWRNDLPRVHDQVPASLAEYRQIVRFDFQHLPDGKYQVVPRVVLERRATREHRITITAKYQDAFLVSPEQTLDYSIDQPVIPYDYWYATGRDYALERDLADEITHRVAPK